MNFSACLNCPASVACRVDLAVPLGWLLSSAYTTTMLCQSLVNLVAHLKVEVC